MDDSEVNDDPMDDHPGEGISDAEQEKLREDLSAYFGIDLKNLMPWKEIRMSSNDNTPPRAVVAHLYSFDSFFTGRWHASKDETRELLQFINITKELTDDSMTKLLAFLQERGILSYLPKNLYEFKKVRAFLLDVDKLHGVELTHRNGDGLVWLVLVFFGA